ncbi:MAG: hypothetical protein ACYDIA_14480, partial [Candidatus Humimicrobiaceae bacterium]
MQNTNMRKQSKEKSCWLSFLVALTIFLMIAIFIGTTGCALIPRTVPSLDELNPSDSAETSKVYALDGTLIT